MTLGADLYPTTIPQITNGTWNAGGLLVLNPAPANTITIDTFAGYATAGVGGTAQPVSRTVVSGATTVFTATPPRLVNVSVLKRIPAGATLTAGFVIGGATAKTVLIRVVGPTLTATPVNVAGAMADPQLVLFNSAPAQIAANDNWGGDAQLAAAGTAVGAFALSGPASKDAVLLVTLPPGSYTAQASGVGNTGGMAIIEVYEVP